MDLLGPCNRMEKGNQYMLTVICMLTKYVFMISIKTKTTEDIINAYLKHVYAFFRGSKYILSDRSGEFSSKQFMWLAKEIGFTKVYTYPYTPMGNLGIERTHTFLNSSL